MGQVSKSVYVYVVDRGTIELCDNETLFGVNWPASSPGSPILAECPKRYEGQSQRICELRDFGKPTWLTPNFSGCLADTLVDVYNEVSFTPFNLLLRIKCETIAILPSQLIKNLMKIVL